MVLVNPASSIRGLPIKNEFYQNDIGMSKKMPGVLTAACSDSAVHHSVPSWAVEQTCPPKPVDHAGVAPPQKIQRVDGVAAASTTQLKSDQCYGASGYSLRYRSPRSAVAGRLAAKTEGLCSCGTTSRQ